jgi:hypothetical protein
MNVEKPYGIRQELRLMIGAFTHKVHVISTCVLQTDIISYIEIKFCTCASLKIFFHKV